VAAPSKFDDVEMDAGFATSSPTSQATKVSTARIIASFVTNTIDNHHPELERNPTAKQRDRRMDLGPYPLAMAELTW